MCSITQLAKNVGGCRGWGFNFDDYFIYVKVFNDYWHFVYLKNLFIFLFQCFSFLVVAQYYNNLPKKKKELNTTYYSKTLFC